MEDKQIEDVKLALEMLYESSDKVDETPDTGTDQPQVSQPRPVIQDAWMDYSCGDKGKREQYLDNEKEGLKMGMNPKGQHGQDPWSASGASTGPKSYGQGGVGARGSNSWPGPQLGTKGHSIEDNRNGQWPGKTLEDV